MRGLSFAGATSALFVALLALPAVRMPFVEARKYEKDFRVRENRAPARLGAQGQVPAGLHERLQGLEAWFTDRFGFRMELIALKTRLYLLAGQSPREDLAILGSDGWLFLGNSQSRALDKASGRVLFSEEELEDYAADLERRHRLLADRGVRLMVFVIPEKQTIYPEHLPAWARNPTGRTMTTQLAERLRGSEVSFTDLTGTLRDARAGTSRLVYFKGDTHWNGLGAFAAYRGIMDVVRGRFPEARVLDEPPFEERPKKSGDLARMLKVPETLEPRDVMFIPRFGGALQDLSPEDGCVNEEAPTTATADAGKRQVAQGAKGKGRKGPGAKRPLMKASIQPCEPGDRKCLQAVPNYCQPGQAAVIRGSGVERGPRVLVLGDSFVVGLSPYLNHSFGEVAYTYYPNAVSPRRLLQYVERYRPDLVLLQMVGRGLMPVGPRRRERSRQDLTPQPSPPAAARAD